MKTDFKFWFIRRDDNGFITDCGIRFYEGDITTENEIMLDREVAKDFVSVPVTRYRRLRRLNSTDLKHLKSEKTMKEANGEEAIIYTADDFGNIKTDAELCLFLNSELKKDSKRTPIEEQK